MAHALFAPSSSERWLACPGSIGLGLQHRDGPDGPYAAEGTRLHDLAAKYIDRDSDEPLRMSEEDRIFLNPYLAYAAERIEFASAWAVEETIHHSQVLFGTPDLLLLFKDEDLLEVVDLKTGAGIMVDPEENDQALCYAYMSVSKMVREGLPIPKNIRLTIVQPPDEERPVKSWDTTSEYVLAWGARAEATIEIALAGAAPIVPGEHCRFCKAKPTCPALRGELVEALGGSMPSTMTMGSLAQWLDRADRMEGFVKSLREVGHAVASDCAAGGKPGIPGWGLKSKRATRSWADEDKVLEIARRRKIRIYQDKLLSPAMAEKVHPNLPEELRDQIVAVSSGLNLVRLKGDEPEAAETLKPEADPMEKLMVNFGLLKFRR